MTQLMMPYVVSTHSRLKAAGQPMRVKRDLGKVSTHSRLKAAGANLRLMMPKPHGFQHTAA